MLSWAGNDSGITVDLTAIAGDGHDIELEHGSELLQFATACAGRDDDQLAERRRALENATSRAFMVDAAAVAANFEMMTRLADGTGARMPSEVIEQRSATIGAMGVGRLTSKR
jgi:hypothetical protein